MTCCGPRRDVLAEHQAGHGIGWRTRSQTSRSSSRSVHWPWGIIGADLSIPGPDAGKGGKHLVLPPADNGEAPAGHYTSPSTTNLVVLAARKLPQNGDIKGALEDIAELPLCPQILVMIQEGLRVAVPIKDKTLGVVAVEVQLVLQSPVCL